MSIDSERYNKERLERIEGDISMLRNVLEKHNETIHGISLGMDRINNTLSRIIEAQENHAKRLKEIKDEYTKTLKEIEAVSFLSRHWKFIAFTVLTIIIVSLCIHVSVKELMAWVF